MILVLHIVAGSLGIVSGFVALYAGKGQRVHRRSGLLFAGAMVVLGVSGAVIAALAGGIVSIVAGLLTTYLVITALTTVRPRSVVLRRVDAGALVVALVLAVVSVSLAVDAMRGGRLAEGIPVPVLIKFALVAFLGAAGDLRVLRAGAPLGARRIARHLWRMCFALYIAAASFFLGQADELPEAIRIMPLLAMPVLAVVVTMFYWLWRVGIRRRLGGVTLTPRPAPPPPRIAPVTPATSARAPS
ncbi:MAG: hypothetical protein M3Y31_09050 [Gemmatimonadota bacterium]|nr:hypothetical protein [Gemmatimonadota bacterium]